MKEIGHRRHCNHVMIMIMLLLYPNLIIIQIFFIQYTHWHFQYLEYNNMMAQHVFWNIEYFEILNIPKNMIQNSLDKYHRSIKSIQFYHLSTLVPNF
jgi:hypothetical protein